MRLIRKTSAVLLTLVVLFSAQYIEVKASNIAFGAATVSASALNIRSEPSTEAAVLKTLNENERLVILEKTSDA